MNRIYISLRDIPTTRLQLGFEGENDHTQVIFDGTLLYARYPSAVASMTVKSPSGGLYPKTLVQSGNKLAWTITASDCAKFGSGQYQLTFTSGTEVIKTYIGSFSVNASLLGSGDPPDPVEDWLQEAQEALDAFEQDVTDAEAWAVGTRDGEPVESTDPAYHNNSKYYSKQAKTIEQTIETTGAAQVSAIEAKGEEVLESIPSDYTALSEDVDELYAIKAPAIECSASGSIATFTDGADDMPLKSMSVAIEPVQEGEGDPSPENVRPITGFTGVKVTRTGKNLFGGTLMRDGIKASLPSATIDEETKTIAYNAGTTVKVSGFTTAAGLTGKFKENTAYTIILTGANQTTQGANFRIFYTDGSYIQPEVFPETNVKYTFVITTSSAKTLHSIRKANSSGRTRIYYEESGIFEGDLTADDFVPYEGESYDIEFPSEPGTVYGGTLDVVTGVLTVDRLKKQVLSTDVVNESSSVAHRYYTNTNYVTGIAPHTTMLLCDAFKVTNQSTKVGEAYVSEARQAIFNTNFSALSEFKSWIDTNGLSFIYQLATPLTYILTPQEVRTLLGVNNIFSDAGNVSVTYPADTKAYIDNQIANTRKLIAGIETDFTASKAYAVGDMLIIGNDLYKAIASIASGATITVGTNVTKTTVAEQLIALANA